MRALGDAVYFVAETVFEPLGWPGDAVLRFGAWRTAHLSADDRLVALRSYVAIACRFYALKRLLWAPVFAGMVWLFPSILDEVAR